MKNFKWFALLCAVVFSLSLFSCSSDSSEELEGANAVAWIKSQVLDEAGQVAFAPTDVKDVYAFCVDDKETAYSLASGITSQDIKDANFKYSLPAGYGNVNIREASEAGHYCTMDFNVKGIPTFQLDFMNVEAYNNENVVMRPPYGSNIYFICTNCGSTFTFQPSSCSKCGGRSFTKMC